MLTPPSAGVQDFLATVVKKLPAPVELTVEQSGWKGKAQKTIQLHFVCCRATDPGSCMHADRAHSFVTSTKEWARWIKIGVSLHAAGKATLNLAASEIEAPGEAAAAGKSALGAFKAVYQSFKAPNDGQGEAEQFEDMMAQPFLTTEESERLLNQLRSTKFFELFSYDPQCAGWCCPRCRRKDEARTADGVLLSAPKEGVKGNEAVAKAFAAAAPAPPPAAAAAVAAPAGTAGDDALFGGPVDWAALPPMPCMEGFLHKRAISAANLSERVGLPGEKVSDKMSWKKRYFRLVGAQLMYFRGPGDLQPINSTAITQHSQGKRFQHPRKEHCFSLESAGRAPKQRRQSRTSHEHEALYCQCAAGADADKWVAAIEGAVAWHVATARVVGARPPLFQWFQSEVWQEISAGFYNTFVKKQAVWTRLWMHVADVEVLVFDSELSKKVVARVPLRTVRAVEVVKDAGFRHAHGVSLTVDTTAKGKSTTSEFTFRTTNEETAHHWIAVIKRNMRVLACAPE
jgi:hypothetical protein